MESSCFLFFLYKMYILVGEQHTYDNITGFFLGVTSPEQYSYLMVHSENYRLLDSFTVNNKELKLTQKIIIKDLYLYQINNSSSNAIVKDASKISYHTQYTPISSLAQHSKSIAVKVYLKYTYYKIGICCFSANYAALSRKSQYWLARNQNNVPVQSDMSTRGLLFQ